MSFDKKKKSPNRAAFMTCFYLLKRNYILAKVAGINKGLLTLLLQNTFLDFVVCVLLQVALIRAQTRDARRIVLVDTV